MKNYHVVILYILIAASFLYTFYVHQELRDLEDTLKGVVGTLVDWLEHIERHLEQS